MPSSSPVPAPATFGFMLGSNLNSRLDSPLPAYQSSSCPISPPPPAHHFPPASFPLYLHLSLLPLGLRYGLREGSPGEVVVSIQPSKLGLSLSVSLSGTKKPDFPSALGADFLFTQRPQIKTDQACISSQPFLKALFLHLH